ncbi:hypothetical protein GCM10023221_18800 [Luteimicrobium xylanilyticum]
MDGLLEQGHALDALRHRPGHDVVVLHEADVDTVVAERPGHVGRIELQDVEPEPRVLRRDPDERRREEGADGCREGGDP